jgi:hypothetical protein
MEELVAPAELAPLLLELVVEEFAVSAVGSAVSVFADGV